MNRRMALLILAFALPLFADDKKAKDESLLGKWEVVSAHFNGAEVARLKGRVIVMDNAKMVINEKDEKAGTLSYSIDAKVDPKQIDLERASSKLKALGIYTVDKGELRICYGEPGAARPKKFESIAGDKNFLLVLKKAKMD